MKFFLFLFLGATAILSADPKAVIYGGQMQYAMVERPEMRMVGLCVRTNNKAEFNKLDGKIFPLVKRWFHEALAEKIPHRKNPGTTLCAYTDYESDENGDYTYFIGEEVTKLDPKLSKDFKVLTIPRQTYAKFTNGPAPMPDVLTHAWSAIWKMTPKELGGKRAYATDFEVYDERSLDHQKIVMDFYIGIKKAPAQN